LHHWSERFLLRDEFVNGSVRVMTAKASGNGNGTGIGAAEAAVIPVPKV
jgi:hypothetical protein